MDLQSIVLTTEKKKRGRKPKNKFNDILNNNILLNQNVVVEKKKRGRKKKYEIDNLIKINNRGDLNNFDHKIVYSDSEEFQINSINNDDDSNNELNNNLNNDSNNDSTNDLNNNNNNLVSNISFGNLNIVVSKKNTTTSTNYRNQLIEKTNEFSNNIDQDEYSSDEDKTVSINNIITNEKYFNDKNINSYIPESKENIVKDNICKKLKVITTLKNIIKDSVFPEKTDICCWWCCHKFSNSPCTLPIKYDVYKKIYSFIGIFCSWNCVKSYNIDLKDQKVHSRASLISMLVKQIYGIHYAMNIKSAPPRQSLKMFGGYMLIDEFRSAEERIDLFRLNLINHNFIYPDMIEITNVKRKIISNKQPLRLFRS